MTFDERDETGPRPDDPRITAYAFGELEGDERAAIEAAVAADPALRTAVAELRAFEGELGATLAGELKAGAAEMPSPAATAGAMQGHGRVLPFPAWVWAAAGLAAAAGVALMISRRETAPAHVSGTPVAVAPEAVEVALPKAEPVARAVAFPVRPAPLLTSGVAVDTGSFVAAPKLDLKEFGTVSVPTEHPVANGAAGFPDLGTDKLFALFGDSTKAVGGGVNEVYAASGQAIHLDGRGRDANRAKLIQAVDKGWQRPGSVAETPAAMTLVSAGYVNAPAASLASLPATPAPHEILRSPYVAEGDWKKTRGGPLGGVSVPPPAGAPAPLLGDIPVLGRAFAFEDRESRVHAGGEAYADIRENGFVSAEAGPLSTFSIDVDTASYANVRRFLREGARPPRDAVRIEELVNYFPYRYAPPEAGDGTPFAANLAVASAPWAPAHRLVRIGIKGRELSAAARPAASLVFLVDVSGSMSAENKLPLVKSSLRELLGQLRDDDRVAIVTYAGASGLALPSTPVARRGEILEAVDRLESGGSTNGGMGIHLAYDIAKANFAAEGLNRVILCTDGDFNVGVTGREELLALIQEKARSRVFLTVLGFGMGNLKDGTLELLADKGNGAYGYIDSEREARKVFVEQVGGTLATIAKDVKIQVEFNPARVASYRLIGYENRALAKEDFNNDQVDAGEVGAGHTVTALYEVVPAGAAADEDGASPPQVDALKYGPHKKPAAVRRLSASPAGESGSDELLTVKIRYKEPMGDVSRKREFPLVDKGADFAAADREFKFAAAVAAWGMWLRGSPHAGTTSIDQVLAWAEDGLGDDPGGHRAEFVELVRRSQGLRD